MSTNPSQQPPNYPPQQPPGYTPQPPYGQQPYGQQPYGQPYVQPKMNTLALVGFICSFFISLVGLVLCIIGLNQINSANGAQTGKGLAIAGIVIGAIGTVFIPLRILNAFS